MKKLMFIGLLLTVGVCGLFAQKKAVNEAEGAVSQDKPDFKTAEPQIKGALVNDETKNDAKTWYVAGLVYKTKYDEERKKQYLKMPFDESMIYESLYEAYNYWIKAIALDNQPDKNGKIKPKFEKKIKEKIVEDFQMLINAGAFFYDKKNFNSAYKHWNFYNQSARSEELKSLKLGTDSTSLMIPYYASSAALRMNNDSVAISSLEFSKKFSYEKYNIYNFLADAYKRTNLTEKYIETLKEGNTIFPDSNYFVGNLINNYINIKDYDNAIKFLNDAISHKPNENLYVALGEVYEEAGKGADLSKGAFQKAIELNPKNHTAYFYIGRSSYNKAVDLTNKAYETKDKKKQAAMLANTKTLFKEAMPSFQKALELNPKSLEYLNPLRSIYYNLNMNKEFDAIDKEIKSQQKK